MIPPHVYCLQQYNIIEMAAFHLDCGVIVFSLEGLVFAESGLGLVDSANAGLVRPLLARVPPRRAQYGNINSTSSQAWS